MTEQPWGASPPSVNSTVIETGSTSATWAAASSAWLGMASAVLATAGLTGTQMFATIASTQGVRSMTRATLTPPFMAWLGTLAGIAFKQAAICAVVAESYGVARTTMIPTPQSVNNRVREASAEATNFFGQNTPLIGALDAEYAAYTAQNAAIGTTYGSVITAATIPVPIPPPPPLANPAGVADTAAQATAGVAQVASKAGTSAATKTGMVAGQAGQQSQTAGTGSMGQLTGQLGSATQLFQAPLQAVQGLGSSLTAPMQSLSGMLSAPMSMFGSMSPLQSLTNGGGTGSSFMPLTSGAGLGLPLGSSGPGTGGLGSGIGSGGIGGAGMGGLGGGPSKQLTGSSGSSSGRVSTLSGIAPEPGTSGRASNTFSGRPGMIPPMMHGPSGGKQRGSGQAVLRYQPEDPRI